MTITRRIFMHSLLAGAALAALPAAIAPRALAAPGKTVVGWGYKVDGGEAKTLIPTRDSAVTAAEAFTAITDLKTAPPGGDLDLVLAKVAIGPRVPRRV